MKNVFSLNYPLHSRILSENNSFIKQALLLIAGVVLLASASQLYIPLSPIPLTFQAATAIFIGMSYGARNAAYVIIMYYVAGILGLPVFAGYTSTILKFTSPTGGFLLGFLPAAIVCGYLAEHGFARNFFSCYVAALIGMIVIFSIGIAMLATFMNFHEAIKVGLMPFIISEPIKLIALSLIVPKLWK